MIDAMIDTTQARLSSTILLTYMVGFPLRKKGKLGVRPEAPQRSWSLPALSADAVDDDSQIAHG
jgi:hypothetical protein